MSFALDLQKFAEKVGERADDAIALIVTKVATEIDERSPVGDAKYWKHPAPKGYIGGRFRANWQLGIGSIPAGVVNRVDTSGVTVSGIIAEIPEEASGKVYYLANNLPYALRIEDGWSRQAPSGVVGLTAIKFQQIANDAVEAVR